MRVLCAWSARMAQHTDAPAERRLVAVGAHLAASRPLPLMAAPAAAAMPRPQGFVLMAHRGGQELWPENTLPAFLSAVERLGPEPCIEFDVQLTSDGVPVVIHDHTVDREPLLTLALRCAGPRWGRGSV